MKPLQRIVGAVLLLATFTLVGCSGGVQEKTITVPGGVTPLQQAKDLLEHYARGNPLGSEVTSFPHLVEEVRKTDPAVADTLDRGFKELQRPGGDLAGRAKELLKKI